jgi:hypothetical protein
MPRPQAEGEKRFKCSRPGCSYSFAKATHRARHELTHSGSKAFACDLCQRRFARNDALVRHARIHLQSSTSVSGTTAAEASASPTDMAQSSGAHQDVSCPLGPNSPTRANHADNLNMAAPDEHNTSLGVINPTYLESGLEVLWDDSFASNSAFWEELLRNMTPGLADAQPDPITPLLPNSTSAGDLGARSRGTVPRSSETTIQRALSALNDNIRSLPSTRIVARPDSESELHFLDSLRDCLDNFLSRFSNILPVIHQGTFDIDGTAPSTLMLMLAIGSAFMGDSTAAARGESLWSLAHVVAMTSWPTMLANYGMHDGSPGVQLVLTATLGQSFALMSSSQKLRTTVQVVHGLGFHWARQCGMYDHDYNQSSCVSDAVSSLTSRWKGWAATEVQLRALLAHYILDGQIAQCSNKGTCVRHCTNPLPMPAENAMFDAEDAESWERLRSGKSGTAMSFREFILGLCSPYQLPFVKEPVPTLAIRVILESFQSLASDRFEAGGDSFGLPSQREVTIGMFRLYWSQIVENEQAHDLALRWHSIFGFSISTNIHELGCRLCRTYGIEQNLLSAASTSAHRPAVDISVWIRSYKGRATLLHSLSICDRLQKLPLADVMALHLPYTVFSAAVTFIAFLSAGQMNVSVPAVIEWVSPEQRTAPLEDDEGRTIIGPETELFCQSVPIQHTVVRKLRVELQGLRTQMRILGATWGVCIPMEALLESLNQAIEETTSAIHDKSQDGQ